MCFTFAITATTVISSKVMKTCDFLKACLDTFPMEAFVCGSVAGTAGRAAVMPLDPNGLAPLAMMVRGKEGSAAQMATLYRFLPFWGLRMAIYTNSAPHYGRGNAQTSAIKMAPYWFLTGCWTEAWVRTITSPFNKVRYHRDLMIEEKLPNASVLGAIQKLTKERGPAGMFQDTAKYRVEVPRMGVLFAVYHSLRNAVLQQVHEDPGQVHVGIRAAVDLVAGGAAGAASVYATHGLRQATYDAASVFAQRSLELSLRQEVPLTAAAMVCYGLAMSALVGVEKDAKLSGWEEVEREVSAYGGEGRRGLGALSVLD